MPAGLSPRTHGALTIPSLDGIRCIAVMIVFIGHGATIGGPWPGDVGVTIFFFLSGYLITTLLRREYDRTRQISLGRFYLRRVLRILPPAYIAILLTALVGLAGILPSTMDWSGILAQVFQVTNYYMVWADAATGSAHTGLPPESSMLWSLAVEEHFYLVFPAALTLLLRRRLTYRTIGLILVGAFAVAPLWRLFLFLNDAGFYRLYISTDTRFDGLLAGAALALLANPALGDARPFGISERTMRFVAAPVAATVFIVVALAPQSFGLTVGDSILYVCLVPLFWVVIAHPRGVSGRILNNRVVAHVGVLSFSIYLLHRLALGLVELVVEVPIVVDATALVLCVLAAQVMYMAVEKPLGRVRRRLETRIPAYS